MCCELVVANFCQAEGREAEETRQESTWRFSRDIFVPRAEDGLLYYTLMEIVNMGEPGHDWTLQHKATQQTVSTVTTTSASPGAPILSRSY
jgi:hypothetical protein